MATGEKCIINTCTNIISKGRKGLLCGTCIYRKKNFDSYDLPNHKGNPSYPVYVSLPEGMVKKCDKHGFLSIDEVYPKYYKQVIASYNCKKCMLSDNIRNKYKGLSGLEDYDRMLAEQNGCCAMCGGQNTVTRNGKIKRFAIDHCHKSKKVRGLLCSFCNSLLGYAKDSIETLQSAIDYLNKHKEEEK